MANKDSLRSSTIGAEKDFAKEIEEWDGKEFEIRQPSVSARSKILQKAQQKPGMENLGDVELSKMQIYSVIYCTFVPGTNERVFDEGDIPALIEQPTDSFVDKFASTAMRLMNAKAEEKAKN